MSQGPYIRTYSGKKFYILHPKPDQFDIRDISHGLSFICRFTGQTRQFLSVSQHSSMVSDLLPDSLKLTGLLHDATENFLNDLNTQTKSLLPQYKAMEINIERVLSKKFGLIFPFPPEIKQADLTMLASEMRWFMKSGGDWKNIPYRPIGRFEAWSPERARREFMKRFNRLSK